MLEKIIIGLLGIFAGYFICAWRLAKYTDAAKIMRLTYDAELKGYRHGIKHGIQIMKIRAKEDGQWLT